jgi:Fe-S-cluster containining protein
MAAPDESAPASAALGELERQMERASMFAQASLDRMAVRVRDAEAQVAGLLDLLRARGLLSEDDLPGQEGGGRARRDGDDPEARGSGMESPAPLQWPSIAFRVEQGELPAPQPVNCAERMHICHAVCCKLDFALTPDEVDAGKVKWDLGFPYLVRHNADGYCVHNDRETGRCKVYADRPGVCRRYSCADDSRIWKDFEKMELNHEWLDANVPRAKGIRLRRELPMASPNGHPAGKGGSSPG